MLDTELQPFKVEIKVGVYGKKVIQLELEPIMSVWPEKLGINVLKKEKRWHHSKPD